MQVGWLGLGAIGSPMAARAGHAVRGYDVVPGRLRPWRETACGPRTRRPPRPAAPIWS
jgi:3-hydroxyisobutyrate dehydrogenase-like beta-hydroxyacid dehydrogenase